MVTEPGKEGWDEVIRFDNPDPKPHSEMPYWKLMDPYYDQVDFRNEPDEALRQFAELPPAAATLIAVNLLCAEVVNGGFAQFFFNRWGLIAPEAVSAYHAVGLPDVAEIIERAMKIVAPVYPRNKAVRRAMVEKIEAYGADDFDERSALSQLMDLTSRYYDALGKEHQRLVDAMNAYAVRHGAK